MHSLTPFYKGQKLSEMSAEALNRLGDAAGKPAPAAPAYPAAGTGPTGNNIIVGINETGQDLEPGDVVRVMLSQTAEDMESSQLYTFTIPTASRDPDTDEPEFPDYPVAVIRSGGPDRGIVYASVYGREIVTVVVGDDPSHTCATVQDRQTDLETAKVGPFRLLGMPPSGRQRWPVYFPLSNVGEEEEDDDPGEGGGQVLARGYAIGIISNPGPTGDTVMYRQILMYNPEKNTVELTDEMQARLLPLDFRK